MDIADFWSYVDTTGECWEWLGNKNKKGYGRLYLPNGKRVGAHRVAYMLTHGEIALGMCVCHHCDNPLCCRPDHLFLGTNADNLKDMWAKGRGFRGQQWDNRGGEGNPNARLTWEQVREIRKRYAQGGVTQKELGKDYGVADTTVSQIITRLVWKES